MRHHAITVVEPTSSRGVAIAFARHEPEDVNGRYTVARPREVAAVVVTGRVGTVGAPRQRWPRPPARGRLPEGEFAGPDQVVGDVSHLAIGVHRRLSEHLKGLVGG